MTGSSDHCRCPWERVADVLAEFLVGLVETDDWVGFFVLFLVQRQYRIHAVDEFLVALNTKD